jgi:alkylated DNA repair protein alkB family protein 1
VERVLEPDLNLSTSVQCFGLKPVKEWNVYRTKNNVIIIKNPFNAIAQRYWIVQCLKTYTKYPNKNNLLENQFDRSTIENFWESWMSADDVLKRKLKKSFRWTTLGFHYDWTNKIYDENVKNEFPPDANKLMHAIGEALNFSFKSEAAIINFYPIGTTLSSHTDHSEIDHKSPLISVSFGQDAIFLAGGLERDSKPVLPFKLCSGDILVMSKESRLIYHAVPKIFKSLEEPWNEILENSKDFEWSEDIDKETLKICLNKETWSKFDEYIKDVRINLNVRQVLPDGKTSFS